MDQNKVLMIGIKTEKKMSSRASILSKIKANKPELISLPNIDATIFNDASVNLFEEFKKKVEIVGGNVFTATSHNDIIGQVGALYPETNLNYSALEDTDSFNTISLNTLQKPHDLEDLDILILEGSIGVAENGAIWVSDNQLPVRVLPFITKHLILVLNEKSIVSYMHQAYQILHTNDTDFGFGVFLSGPSKTADIEQSLVIGAQGALSVSVFIKTL